MKYAESHKKYAKRTMDHIVAPVLGPGVYVHVKQYSISHCIRKYNAAVQ